jgi:hypothetical protein
MSKDQRKRVLLGALLVVMLAIAWRQVGPRFGGGAGAIDVGSRARAATKGATVSVLDSPEVVELRLGDLEKMAGQFRPGRDPFRFGEVEAARAEPTEDEAADAEREAAALDAMRRAMEAQRSQTSDAPSRPALPDLDVKFLGSFGSRQTRLAVFSDGDEIFNVLEGGILKGHFVIRQIGFESVDVGYADYPDEPPIRLAVGG